MPVKNNKGFSIKAKDDSGESLEIIMYEDIGEWGISAVDFVKNLNEHKNATDISLRINSPGGSVFDGVTIFNGLKRHKATVNVFVDGLAASIASLIAMAGDTVTIAENAMMMIHDPWTIAMGSSIELRAQADMMDKAKDGMITSYVAKSGLSDKKVSDLMTDETWLTAQESVDLGFADSVGEASAMAAKFNLDKYKFQNTPDCLKGECDPTDRVSAALGLTATTFQRDDGSTFEMPGVVREGLSNLVKEAVKLGASIEAIKEGSNLVHNSETLDDEPKWNESMYDNDHADDLSGNYSHHYESDGKLYLQREGLAIAWAVAQGIRTGEQSDQDIIDHLASHRADIGIEAAENEVDRIQQIAEMVATYVGHDPDICAKRALENLTKAGSILRWEKTASEGIANGIRKRKLQLAEIEL